MATFNSFSELVNSAPVVLVEFYASWCPHCQKMMPVVAQIQELLEGRADVYQFDIDENQKLANEVDVQSIPSFLVYHNGQVAWRHTGEIDGEVLLGKVESLL